MNPVDVFCGSAALLLIASGPVKVFRPGAARKAVQALQMPGLGPPKPLIVRLGGLAETAVGVYVLVRGDLLSVSMLAVTYLLFLFVALRLPSTVDCGCFGGGSAPASRGHVTVTIACSGVALAAAANPPGPLAGLRDASSASAATTAVLAVLLTVSAYLTLTSLPALTRARRSLEASR